MWMRVVSFLLLLPTLAWGFVTTPVLDTFTGDATPIGAPWTDAVFGNAGCRKLGGVAIKTGATTLTGCYITATVGANQEVYATLPAVTTQGTGTSSYLLGCLIGGVGTATTDGYGVRFQKIDAAPDDIELVEVNDAVYTQIDTADQEMVNGDEVGLKITSTGTIQAWFRPSAGSWALVDTLVDTTHTCTTSNIGMNLTNTAHQIDNFGGGTTVVPSTGGSIMMLLLK
jgi:hypothetical protein